MSFSSASWWLGRHARRERAGGGLLEGDLRAVRRPGGRRVEVRVARELADVRPVRVHDVDLLVARGLGEVEVAAKDDLCPVGRVGRITLVARALKHRLGDRLRRVGRALRDVEHPDVGVLHERVLGRAPVEQLRAVGRPRGLSFAEAERAGQQRLAGAVGVDDRELVAAELRGLEREPLPVGRPGRLTVVGAAECQLRGGLDVQRRDVDVVAELRAGAVRAVDHVAVEAGPGLGGRGRQRDEREGNRGEERARARRATESEHE